MIPKFRAWDKLNKRMCDVANIDFMTKVVELRHDIPFYFLPFSEVVLMQSTGLKDKNGVEIFEGDLVESDDYVDGTWETFEAIEIVYDADYAQFCFKSDASNFLAYYRNLRIIGNVYEKEVAE